MTTAVPPEMSARSAQTLSMLVKVVSRVSVLGQVPSDMRQAAQLGGGIKICTHLADAGEGLGGVLS